MVGRQALLNLNINTLRSQQAVVSLKRFEEHGIVLAGPQVKVNDPLSQSVHIVISFICIIGLSDILVYDPCVGCPTATITVTVHAAPLKQFGA